jgi:hypothetical protein
MMPYTNKPDVNIVLVNGNNNEVDGATVQKPNPNEKKGGSIGTGDAAVVFGSGNMENKPEIENTEKPEKKEKDSSFWGGIFDTANLLVKKTG